MASWIPTQTRGKAIGRSLRRCGTKYMNFPHDVVALHGILSPSAWSESAEPVGTWYTGQSDISL